MSGLPTSLIDDTGHLVVPQEIPAVLGLIRGDESAASIANRLGVTESEVRSWENLFLTAGILALQKSLAADISYPTTGVPRP